MVLELGSFPVAEVVLDDPIILDLLRRHGRDVNLLGVVLMRIRYTTHQEKLLVSSQAAGLAGALGDPGGHRHLARGQQHVHRGDAHGPGVREGGDQGGAGHLRVRRQAERWLALLRELSPAVEIVRSLTAETSRAWVRRRPWTSRSNVSAKGMWSSGWA